MCLHEKCKQTEKLFIKLIDDIIIIQRLEDSLYINKLKIEIYKDKAIMPPRLGFLYLELFLVLFKIIHLILKTFLFKSLST